MFNQIYSEEPNPTCSQSSNTNHNNHHNNQHNKGQQQQTPIDLMSSPSNLELEGSVSTAHLFNQQQQRSQQQPQLQQPHRPNQLKSLNPPLTPLSSQKITTTSSNTNSPQNLPQSESHSHLSTFSNVITEVTSPLTFTNTNYTEFPSSQTNLTTNTNTTSPPNTHPIITNSSRFPFKTTQLSSPYAIIFVLNLPTEHTHIDINAQIDVLIERDSHFAFTLAHVIGLGQCYHRLEFLPRQTLKLTLLFLLIFGYQDFTINSIMNFVDNHSINLCTKIHLEFEPNLNQFSTSAKPSPRQCSTSSSSAPIIPIFDWKLYWFVDQQNHSTTPSHHCVTNANWYSTKVNMGAILLRWFIPYHQAFCFLYLVLIVLLIDGVDYLASSIR